MSQNYDDPIWEYTMVTKLQPYIPYVKRWWAEYEKHSVLGTGVFDFKFEPGEDPIDGLFVRMTSTPVRSPIKNVQMFPFVPTAYLQMSGVPGGVNRMVERECAKGLVFDGIRVIEKHNLPSTYHKGQFLAFIPEDILNNARQLGKYVYLTADELCAIAAGVLPKSVSHKASQYTSQ